MRLSTKARYAARAMVELAINYNSEPVKLKDIARNQDISIKYLEQLMNPLRVSGFVSTQKGSRGGYKLIRQPGEVTLYDIVECVEGSLAPVDCVDSPEVCDRVPRCVTRNVWVNVHRAIIRELKSVTLAALAEEQKQKRVSEI